MENKTKVLRGETARKVLDRVSKTESDKIRSAEEVRSALYGRGKK